MKYTIMFFVGLILNNTIYFETNGAVNALVYIIYGALIIKFLEFLNNIME